MKKRIQYYDQLERENIINQNSALILLEEQNITEGNFLIFSDTPPEKDIVYTNVPQQDFENLKTKIETTQEAVDFLLMGGM